MANVILKVTLNETKGYLDVDEANNANQAPRGEDTITWQLTGNAASGSFNTMTAQNPGFKWKQDPPDGVFGKPELENNGNEIELSDSNTSASSAGEWVYHLGATINGQQYSTQTVLGPGGNTTNPTIRNE